MLALSAGSIILVEDDAALRRLSTTVLTREGYAVHSFEDGEAALAFLETAGEVGLLATDMTLPGMNGIELAHEFRAQRSETPILIMSGHTMEEIKTQGGLPRGSTYLQKPIGLAPFRETVATLLGE